MVRVEAAAAESLAAMRARRRFGIAIAAMIRMMATTINNSISEKPLCFRIECSSLPDFAGANPEGHGFPGERKDSSHAEDQTEGVQTSVTIGRTSLLSA